MSTYTKRDNMCTDWNMTVDYQRPLSCPMRPGGAPGQREEILDELFATAPLLPGVERLIRHLHAHGVPMAVATSSHARHYELKTRLHRDLFGLFTHIVTGDMVCSRPIVRTRTYTHASIFYCSSCTRVRGLCCFRRRAV
jgi:hypothetical protein